jgi:small-conductance mechanosensitive channel
LQAPTETISAELEQLREAFADMRETGWEEMFDLSNLVQVGGKILIVLVLSWLSFRVLLLLLRRVERAVERADTTTISLHEQRVRTLSGLLRSVGVGFIVVVALFMILRAIGLDIAPLLAGAGVIGLAVSFGAQSLVKDIISGLFILFENQFGVGDVVRIKDVSGRVEKMTLRIVVMRDLHGVVHIVPNGEITQVSNLTRAFSRAVVEIGVAYKEDVDRVIAVLKEVASEFAEDPEWKPLLVDEISIPGIESFGESSVNLRVIATTVPLKQWDVAREVRLRIKRRFDAEGIEIPFPHRTVYWGKGEDNEAGKVKGEVEAT